ncbi:MAG TPA: hypothetical protein V6C86_20820 [Oculatellaceae cyanobacterium]
MKLDLPTIDDTLKGALTIRGTELGKWARRRNDTVAIIATTVGFAIGVSIGIFGPSAYPDFLVWGPVCVVSMYMLGSLISFVAINQATKAMNGGYIHRASHLTARALRLAITLFPLSYLTFAYAVDIKLRLMLYRSRFIEAEAMTLLLDQALTTFSRFSKQRALRLFLANYKAIALLGQTRYADARAIFQDCLANSNRPATRRVLENNIAHCDIEMGRPEQALRLVDSSLTGLGGSKFDQIIGAHLYYNKARALTMLNRLAEAEVAANEALKLGEKSNATVFQTGHCYQAIGEVKMAQGDLHEAEMHLKSALEKMISRFTDCSRGAIEARLILADLLKKMGQDKEAAEVAAIAAKSKEELIEKLTGDLDLLARSASDGSVLALTMNS